MRPADRPRAFALVERLKGYDDRTKSLPGIRPNGHLDCLVEQMVESLRRIEYAHHVRDARHDPRRMDPGSTLFDPLTAAVLRYRLGETDEAFWLVFLATHFGKHAHDGWRLARDIYGKLGQPGLWDWKSVSSGVAEFHAWLTANERRLTGDGVSRRFSNHRKYESIKATSDAGVTAVFSSYVAWVGPPQTHDGMIREIHRTAGQNPKEVFDRLYQSMSAVRRFGRLARFDYLTMLGKLGIAPVEPGSAYLATATGPLAGARLLFGGDSGNKLAGSLLDNKLLDLDAELGVGMQVLEDSLCNWQKSPARFVSFRG